MADPAPLVARAALEAFTLRLVVQAAPQRALVGSQAREDARRASDADLPVLLPFEGGEPLPGVAKSAGNASLIIELICCSGDWDWTEVDLSLISSRRRVG